MNSQEFDLVFARQLEQSEHILTAKGREYSEDSDRLHNFNVAAELQGIKPRQALAGMLAKHIVSVFDICWNDDLAEPEITEEKITDSINYLILLSAIIEEERNAELSDYLDEVIQEKP